MKILEKEDREYQGEHRSKRDTIDREVRAKETDEKSWTSTITSPCGRFEAEEEENEYHIMLIKTLFQYQERRRE